MVRFRTASIGTICLVLTGACQNRDDDRELLSKERARGFVAFVGAGPSDPLWPVLEAGGKEFARTGSRMRFRFLNPASDSPKAQADLLASLDDPDLRGLCIQVNDPESISPALSRLHTRGVAVVSMMVPAPEPLRFAHVGLDQTAIGRELGRCTVDSLGAEGGTVMLLRADERHPVYGPRYYAFMEEIQRASRVSLLADVNCHADPSEARRLIAERVRKYPRLDLWVALEDWALQDDASAEEVFGPTTRYITCGGWPRQWPLVRSGRCPCIVAADYGGIARRAAQFCADAARDPLQNKRIAYLDLQRLTAANLDEYQRVWSSWLAPLDAGTTATSSSPGS